MIHIPIKIGALGVTPDTYPQLYNYLQMMGQVIPLAPDIMKARYDIIVIPPGMGITPNLNCFKRQGRDLLPTEKISPLLEKFRVESLPYYISQETYVIALGDSASILWDKVGGKSIPTSQGVWMIYNGEEVDEVYSSSDFEAGDVIDGFRKDFMFGLLKVDSQLAQTLATIKEEIYEEFQTTEDNSSDQPDPDRPYQEPVLSSAQDNLDMAKDCV